MAKLRDLPLQKRLGVPAFAAALIAFGWATAARGLFDGITLLIGAAAFILTLLQRLPVKPKLEVVPRDDGSMLVAKAEKAVRPLNEDEIIKQQTELCRKEMPRVPAPSFPPGSPLVTPLAGLQASERLLEVTSAVSDASLRKYLGKVDKHADGSVTG